LNIDANMLVPVCLFSSRLVSTMILHKTQNSKPNCDCHQLHRWVRLCTI